MRTTEIDFESLRATARDIAADQPVFMLNLVRYRERADYGGRAGLEPCTGRTAYHERYVPVWRALAPAGAQLVWFGAVLGHLVAPADERWHDAAIVQYPSISAFRQLVESPRYAAEAAHHRRAALEDWRLVALAKMEHE
jgi:uncharacterized protein (DUF1330 family)